jgi:hypothetical protein
LLRNEKLVPAVGPKTDLLPEIDIEKFVFPRGQGVFVTPSEYLSQTEMAEEDKVLMTEEIVLKTSSTPVDEKNLVMMQATPEATPEASGESVIVTTSTRSRRNNNA